MDDHSRFTMGDCHYLARALHKKTGWPMGAISWGNGPDKHAFIFMPDGRLLDVEGIKTTSEMLKEWEPYADDATVEEFEWRELREFGERRYDSYGAIGRPRPVFGRSTYRRAHIVAEKLLEEYA